MARTPILQVREGATEEEIRAAYKAAARIHHPDKGGKEEDFKQLKDEYDLTIESLNKPKTSFDASAAPRASVTTLYKTVKEEKATEVVKNKYQVKFSADSSNADRISALFGFINNNRFSTSKEKSTDLFAGKTKVGEASFLGRFVELVKSVSTKEVPVTPTPDTLKIAASTAPTLRIGPARAA